MRTSRTGFSRWLLLALPVLAALAFVFILGSGTQAAAPASVPVKVDVAQPKPINAAQPQCTPSGYYTSTTTGASIVPGTVDIGNHSDDLVTTFALPFTFNFYNTPFTSVSASSNGNLQFSSTSTSFSNACLPFTTFNYAILPYWDDLRTDGAAGAAGIFTSISGVAPNRIFNIEWRACIRVSSSTCSAVDTNFEARLYEGTSGQIDVVYGAMTQNGSGATTGVQQGTGVAYTQFSCNTAALSNGLQVTYTYTIGDCPTNTPTSTVTPTLTPTLTNTPACTPEAYNIATATAAVIDPGTTLVPGSQGDDAVVTIALPFSYSFYGQSFSSVTASTNGNLQFSSASTSLSNACLPTSTFNNAILPHWDDLLTNQNVGDGIYTSVTGSVGSRIFNIEWRGCLYNAGVCGGNVNFEVRLYEGLQTFELVYGSVANNGSSATIGVQKGTGVSYTQFSCNTASLSTGLKLTFTYSAGTCPSATPTNTLTPTLTRTFTSTPTITNTPACTPQSYNIASASGTVIPGTTKIDGIGCDDCGTTVGLPFPVTIYGQTFNSAVAGSNGHLTFGAVNNGFSVTCLPNSTATYVIAPYWVDQRTDGGGPCTGCGIYTSVTGSAPNRIFAIEYRTVYYNQLDTSPTLDYEVLLFEGQSNFSVVYGNITAFAGTDSSLTIGVQRDLTAYTQYACQPDGSAPPVASGQQLNFTFNAGTCATPTPLNTATATGTPTNTATITNTPTVTNTPACTPESYGIVSTTGAVIDPGLTDTGNHCDDCTTLVSLPFNYSLYGNSFSSASVSSNGQLDFGVADSNYSNSCLPDTATSFAVFPHWDDLMTDVETGCSAYTSGCGIYTSVSGSSPNRVFNIEWRAVYCCSGTPAVNFEVRLFEGQQTFEVIYGTVPNGGISATTGVQRDTTTYTQYSCNTSVLSAGQKLTYTYVQGNCPSPTPTNTATPTATATATNTPICPGDWTAQAVYPITIFDHGAATQGNFIYSFGGTDGTLSARSGSGSVGKSASGNDKSGKSAAPAGTGGSNSKVNVALVSSYKYDSVANTWSPIASLPSARQKPGVVSDGTYIWIVGGVDSANTLQNQVWRYDPATDTYNTAYASYTTSAWAPAVAYLNGKIYKIAGCTDGNCTASTNVVEVYDIASNTWSTVAPLPQSIAWAMAIGLNGKVYVAGGVVPTDSAKTYAYDPGTNTWDDNAIADLPATDWGATSGIVDGKWSIAGGVYATLISTTFVQWDPNTNTWALNDPMLQPRYRGAGGVINNALYVVGGSPGSFIGSTDNQRYFNVCAVPTATATASPTNTPGVRIIGHVTYQGIAQPSVRNVQAITLTLCIGGVGQNFVQNTDNQGFFTVTLSTGPGNYNYRVKSYKNLAKAGTLALANGTNNVEFGTLNTGDSDNNNLINTTDFTRLRNAFGTASNPFTDFNNDGLTNTTDFTLMRNNFGTAGQSLTCP